MGWFGRISAALLVIACACSGFGQRDQELKALERVTITFSHTKLRDAIQQLFEGKSSATVDPDIDGVITASFKDEDFDTVLREVCMSADATYRIENGIYEFVPKISGDFGGGPGFSPPDRSLSIQFTNMPARDAFKMLIGSDLFVDAPVIGTLNGNHRFSSYTDAICWVADQVHAEVVLEHGRYRIRALEADRYPWEDKVVTLKQDRGDIRDALRALFRNVNVNYSIAPEVQGTISCDMTGPFQIVLMRLVASVRSYYRIESGVFQILHEPPPPTNATARQVDIPDRFHEVLTPSNLKFDNVSLGTALSTLFTGVPNRYVVRRGELEHVTADLSNMPLDIALQRILARSALCVRFENGIFIFDLPQSPVKPSKRIIITPPNPSYILRPYCSEGWVTSGP